MIRSIWHDVRCGRVTGLRWCCIAWFLIRRWLVSRYVSHRRTRRLLATPDEDGWLSARDSYSHLGSPLFDWLYDSGDLGWGYVPCWLCRLFTTRRVMARMCQDSDEDCFCRFTGMSPS